MNTTKHPGFKVVFDRKLYKFAPFANRLYYYDTRVGPETVDTPKPKSKLYRYSLLQSVADNKSFYTAREIKGAEKHGYNKKNLDGRVILFINTS